MAESITSTEQTGIETLSILTRDIAIREGMTPTGRKIGVGKVANTALFRLQFVDDKPGLLPEPYRDMKYTKVDLAQTDLTAYLKAFWDMSDKKKAKSAAN